MSTGGRSAVAACVLLAVAVPQSGARDELRRAVPEIRAGAIAQSLTGAAGDPARGRAIALDPARGNCLICHSVPGATDEPFQGNVGPPLAGVGARLTPPQLRARMVDSTQLNPQTVMPAYHRTRDLHRVARPWRGTPVLSAAEIEDVVAWLTTLDTPQQ